MNPITIAIAGVLLVIGIVVSQSNTGDSAQPQESTDLITITPTISLEEIIPTSTIMNTQLPTVPTMPTSTPAPTNKPTIEPTKQPSSNTIESFHYPSATITTSSGSQATMTSTDSADSITQWYEQVIKNNGYSSRATAKTNSNGNIENKLGGGKNNENIMITIKKPSDSSVVTILVTKENGNGNTSIKIQNSTHTSEN